MKRTIEIEDSLEETVESCLEAVKDEFERYLQDNKQLGSCPDMNDLDYSGAIHEIVDGSVPIYTSELEATWYLYSDELEEAYQNAGMGEPQADPEKHIMESYYFYLHDKVCEWFNDEAESLFDEWVESGQNDYSVGDTVFWNDPDNGLTSRNAVISEFKDGMVILDNGEIEASASELEEAHDND